MNCNTLLLAKFQTDNLEANIWIILTIEWQQQSSVYVQESEGNSRPRDCTSIHQYQRSCISYKKNLCTFSDSEKDQQDTTFIYAFPFVIWTRELLWKDPSCLSKLLLYIWVS